MPHQPSEGEGSKPSVRRRLASWAARGRQVLLFAAGVLAALAAMLLYRMVVPGLHVLSSQEVDQLITENLASATPAPAFSETVYRIIQPSLVLIKTESGKDEGLGSGVVISNQGQILTSLHVVKGASTIDVTFADGTTTTAQVLSSQPENDIALLQPAELPKVFAPAVLGNPNAMQVGDEAYAVGNPFGLYSSMSAGVISGFDRSFRPESTGQTLKGLIQIDAAVNPGNSGGPLLNRYGEVVGIVTGIANPTQEHVFIGIGFAVPITVAASGGGSPPY
jgi:S1-C subfamily serine protease